MSNVYNMSNMQIGNGNTMYNIHEIKSEAENEKYWQELDAFLEKRAKELKQEPESRIVAETALNYARRRDRKGLKKFIDTNQETFFLNVLSDVASAGILYVMKKLWVV